MSLSLRLQAHQNMKAVSSYGLGTFPRALVEWLCFLKGASMRAQAYEYSRDHWQAHYRILNLDS